MKSQQKDDKKSRLQSGLDTLAFCTGLTVMILSSFGQVKILSPEAVFILNLTAVTIVLVIARFFEFTTKKAFKALYIGIIGLNSIMIIITAALTG
ncbi:MAG TPA: hypothetical protein VJI75_01975 [Candidatus Nanoarchaeia archaeon]|nr:hypothetical protein [Candidatus Nanoarchaeia archaeon]